MHSVFLCPQKIKKEGNSYSIKKQFEFAGFYDISCKLLSYASILAPTGIKVKSVRLFFVIDGNNIVQFYTMDKSGV